MTEKELITYLQNIKKEEERLHMQKKKLYNEIETLEEAIQRNSFSCHNDDAGTVLSTGFDKSKLHRILMRSYRDIDNELDAVAAQLIAINEQKENIKKMWRCINMLPIRQAEVIEALYIEGMAWNDYEKITCQSHAALGRLRKKAIKHLLSLYVAKNDKMEAES